MLEGRAWPCPGWGRDRDSWVWTLLRGRRGGAGSASTRTVGGGGVTVRGADVGAVPFRAELCPRRTFHDRCLVALAAADVFPGFALPASPAFPGLSSSAWRPWPWAGELLGPWAKQ